MGAVFFEEFQTLTTLYLVLFAASIGVTVCGVAILAYDVGAVYKKLMTQVGIHEKQQLTQQEVARMQFQKKRSVGSTSLQGVGIIEAKLKRQQVTMSPLSMRGFSVDLRAFIGGRRLGRKPGLGPASSSAGARSLPPWLPNDDEESTSRPGLHGVAMSNPVISTTPQRGSKFVDIDSSPTSLDELAKNGSNGYIVSLNSPSAMGAMASIAEDRTTTGNFSSESEHQSSSKMDPAVTSVPSKESVGSTSPDSKDGILVMDEYPLNGTVTMARDISDGGNGGNDHDDSTVIFAPDIADGGNGGNDSSETTVSTENTNTTEITANPTENTENTNATENAANATDIVYKDEYQE